MRILFLSSGPQVPSARFRILPYVRHLRAEGHSCVVAHSFPQKYDYFPWMGFRPSQLLKRSVRWWHWIRARLQKFDLVFVDREIFDDPTWEMEARFRDVCSRLVLDVDDAVFLRYPQKFRHLLTLADLVVCGNRQILDYVRLQNPAVAHVPTSVDIDEYQPGNRSSSETTRPTVGWMGTSGNLKYLSVVCDALRSVAQTVDFDLKLIVPEISSLREMDLTGVRMTHEPWSAECEQRQLQSFDIGLMPLFPNQEWDLYKCGAKLIQYLAVEVPGIATPVGVNSEILDNNQNGFSATTTEEWIYALTTLLTNPQQRRQMGIRGRKTVEQTYSIQANYPVLRDALLRTTDNGNFRNT